MCVCVIFLNGYSKKWRIGRDRELMVFIRNITFIQRQQKDDQRKLLIMYGI